MKKFRSTDALIELLAVERRLRINDVQAATSTLRTTNYYRFTGYARHFQVNPGGGDNNFLPHATFESIHSLMLRDDELRIRLLVALSEIEMKVRTRFAHLTGRYLGHTAEYLDIANYLSDSSETSDRIRKIRTDLLASKQKMVRRYRVDDDISELPIWVAVEVLSFGKIAWMLESLTDSRIRTELALFMGYPEKTLPRVIHSLADLRNQCAHHGQLWNRSLSTQCPLRPNKKQRPKNVDYHHQGLYPAFIALQELAKSQAAVGHLRAVQRRLAVSDVHTVGILKPAGAI